MSGNNGGNGKVGAALVVGAGIGGMQAALDLAEAGIKVYLLEKEEFFDRDHLYGSHGKDYEDNAERFITFCRAIHSLCHALRWSPSILHLHDWQTALAAAYHRTQWRHDPLLADAKTILTIHNLAYQGVFDRGALPDLGLDDSHFTVDRLEFYNKVNLMKGGILAADVVNTVSDTYCREIQTEEMGCGLDGVRPACGSCRAARASFPSRSAWPASSFRGTTRCCSPSARWLPPWPPAIACS